MVPLLLHKSRVVQGRVSGWGALTYIVSLYRYIYIYTYIHIYTYVCMYGPWGSVQHNKVSVWVQDWSCLSVLERPLCEPHSRLESTHTPLKQNYRHTTSEHLVQGTESTESSFFRTAHLQSLNPPSLRTEAWSPRASGAQKSQKNCSASLPKPWTLETLNIPKPKPSNPKASGFGGLFGSETCSRNLGALPGRSHGAHSCQPVLIRAGPGTGKSFSCTV